MTGTAGGGLRYGTPAGRWVLIATIAGSALVFIDGTVVGVALPAIARDLGATSAGLQWTVNGYALTLAALLLLGGSVGDRFGRRRVFVVGTVWFAVASLLCAVAPDVGTLVAARALQGVGGALLTPGSLAILQSTFATEDRARAIGAWSGFSGVSGALAPFLGGWLVETAGWRWVFGINVPLAVAVVLIASRHVPESVDPAAPRRFDVAGTVLTAGGLAGLTWGLTAWSEEGGLSAPVVGSVAGGVVLLVALLAVESRTAAPLLPLSLFRWRPFWATNLTTLLVYGALSGIFFFLGLGLQVVGGYSPLQAGAAGVPVTVLLLALSSRAGALGARTGPRLPMGTGPVVAAVGTAWVGLSGPDAPYLTGILPGLLLLGLGLTLTVAPLTSTALAAAPDRLAGVASATNNAVSRVAGLLAVAVLPLVAGVGAGLADAGALADGYPVALLTCAGLLLAAGLASFALLPGSMAAVAPPVTGTDTSTRGQQTPA